MYMECHAALEANWIIYLVSEEQATFLETLLIAIIDNQSQYNAKWGCGHAKVGMVVQNFASVLHAPSLAPLLLAMRHPSAGNFYNRIIASRWMRINWLEDKCLC